MYPPAVVCPAVSVEGVLSMLADCVTPHHSQPHNRHLPFVNRGKINRAKLVKQIAHVRALLFSLTYSLNAWSIMPLFHFGESPQAMTPITAPMCIR